jgi:hypothetical protein
MLEYASCDDDDVACIVAKFPPLQHLDLRFSLDRSADQDELSQLSALSALTSLSLAGPACGPSGAEQVAQLTRLRELRFGHGGAVADDLLEFTALTNLQQLTLTGWEYEDGWVEEEGRPIEVVRMSPILRPSKKHLLWRFSLKGDKAPVALRPTSGVGRVVSVWTACLIQLMLYDYDKYKQLWRNGKRVTAQLAAMPCIWSAALNEVTRESSCAARASCCPMQSCRCDCSVGWHPVVAPSSSLQVSHASLALSHTGLTRKDNQGMPRGQQQAAG